ncbi:amidase [Protaetiibacter intestinalis]|uniref:Amidase n=1 Tax=Protaetiibacter intestinalis TaxID=2419774 RepID=A0A387B0S4_9MICO|nr:amidase [Protaetiibacter intestinalis]AYF97094.1 amidase [Protaetiibacter intestinalis]
MPEPSFSSLVEQARRVADGETTSRALVDHALARIAALDVELNAFAHVRDQAREEAEALDAELAAGRPRGALHGVPVAIKEENDVAGLVTGFGGRGNSTPASADGEVVRRLRAAGAVVVGTTRMPEFGIWPFTESDAHGITRNPWDLSRSPAGSSGGTGAAVAAGIVAMGIGGDGGGSIRLPASWCGVFGLKPQRGRVSSAPARDLWRALGTRGPLTRTVADSALVYDVISGAADADRYRAAPLPESLLAASAREPGRLRVLLSLANPMRDAEPDADTAAAVRATGELLASLGHEVTEADPRYPDLRIAFQVQLGGGVRDEAAAVEHRDRLEPRTRTVLRIARALAPLGGWAERSSARAGDEFLARVFGAYDVLLMPTTPTAAQPAGRLLAASGLEAAELARPVASFTSIWNVFGNPAASVPAGFDAAGLPLAVQLVGPADSEPLLVSLSAQLEAARPWADRRPALAAD